MNSDDINELKTLLQYATRDNVKKFLTKAIKDSERTISKPVIASSNENSNQEITYKTLTKHYWTQEDKEIIVYVDCEGIGKHSKDKIKVNFGDHSLSVVINDLNGENYKFSIADLSKDINVEKSTYKTTPNRLVFKLRKKNDLDYWTKLRGRDKSDMGTKDFDKDIDDDPSKGLMNMLKRIYEEGDDETKKTVSKAWFEAQNKKEVDF